MPKRAAGKRESKKAIGSMELAAEFLADRYTVGEHLTIRYLLGEMHAWCGTHYERCVDENLLRAEGQRWLAAHGWPHSRRDVSELLEAVRSQTAIRRFDPPGLLAGKLPDDVAFSVEFRNTIADFREDGSVIQTRDHSPIWFSHTSLPRDWEPGAKCPRWLEFLDEIFSGDTERIMLMQQWFGVLLSKSNHLQRILLLIGPPRAGKGIITRIIREMVGPANCCNPTLTSLADRFGLWGMVGKTVALLPDAHLGRNQDGIQVAETLKAISGGDPVDVQRKNLFTLPSVQLQVRFVIAANSLPKLHDPSNALAERQSIIAFGHSHVGREDYGLEARLMAELPGITAWGLRGLASLALNGGRLTEPGTADEIREDYRRLSSPVSAFLMDRCELEPDAVTPNEDLYRAFKAWCRDDEGRHACTMSQFCIDLRAASVAIHKTRTRLDGQRVQCHRGVKLARKTEFTA